VRPGLGSVGVMNESQPSIPIPSDVLNAIAERVADIVIERLGEELRPTNGRWMRTREAAEYLGLTRSALYSRIGDVPHHKIDRLLLFKRDDLDAWLASHRRQPDDRETWIRRSEPILRSRPRKPTRQKEVLPVGPKQGRGRTKTKRERPLPSPVGGDEPQKEHWAAELEIPRAELDAMSPKDSKHAWDARNERLREAGVFDRLSELDDKLGVNAVQGMRPGELIRAVKELDNDTGGAT
jgi:excisionase family DNA binding protein